MQPHLLKLARLLAAAGVVGTSGCAVGPDPFDELDHGVPLEQAYLATTRPADDLSSAANWWQRFEDPTLDELVRQAALGNLDLRAAAARVRQATAARRQASSFLLPDVTAGFNASARDQGEAGGAILATPDVGLPAGLDRGDSLIELYDLSVDVSWQLDLFGRLRRNEQAARLDAIAVAADRLALEHTVVAQVARSRVAVATLQTRLDLAEQNLAALQETRDVVANRYDAGVGDPVQLRLSRENVATAEAALPSLEAQLAAERFALAVLLGQRPRSLGELPETLPPLPPLEPPPVGLPVALLDRRPDLLRDEFRVRAATARVGARTAELFPSLTLGGGVGLSSQDIGDLLDADAFVYNVVASLTTPIFNAGRLRAQVRQARAVLDEQAANYAASILQAVREVNEAMVRESMGHREVAANGRALVEASAAEELARDRLSRGVGDLLAVFEAEQRRRAAEERLALARQGVWNARINLHLALGGDWNVTPQPETQP